MKQINLNRHQELSGNHIFAEGVMEGRGVVEVILGLRKAALRWGNFVCGGGILSVVGEFFTSVGRGKIHGLMKWWGIFLPVNMLSRYDVLGARERTYKT